MDKRIGTNEGETEDDNEYEDKDMTIKVRRRKGLEIKNDKCKEKEGDEGVKKEADEDAMEEEHKDGYHMTRTSAFFAKPLTKIPYDSRTHLRERGRKKPYGPTTKRTVSRVKTSRKFCL